MTNLLCLAATIVGLGCQQQQALCVGGHPTKRQAHVTYAGVPSRHGYQRDHYISLGLGGSDVRENVHYQRCDFTGAHGKCEAGPARDKDDDEHTAEENMCSGRWTRPYAVLWLEHNWPLDAAHGYDIEEK